MSRTKGASYERQIANDLFRLTGIGFKRNLNQYQSVGLDDLTPDDPAWPFALELKRFAAGNSCRSGWKAQAQAAANASGKLPAVVYRFDRQDTRCAVPMAAMCAAFGGSDDSGEWVEITLDGLAYLASEIMAANKEQVPGSRA